MCDKALKHYIGNKKKNKIQNDHTLSVGFDFLFYFFKSPFVGHVTQSKTAKCVPHVDLEVRTIFFPGNDQRNFSHFSQAHFFPISYLDGQMLERPRNIKCNSIRFWKIILNSLLRLSEVLNGYKVGSMLF